MNILITGGTGLIGSALTERFRRDGDRVVTLSRSNSDLNGGKFRWDPESGELDIRALRETEVVIHLAGENIGAGRWTPEIKRRITESRIKGTALLVDSISRLDKRPRLLISASAIGYYGDRGEEILTEESGQGIGFLSKLCERWEAEAQRASELGMRVVCLRTGMVLAPTGGALERTIPMFKWGLGGTLGSGNQYWSWITLDDVVGAIVFAIQNERLAGAVNVVSPSPVTNTEFTQTIAKALHRPSLFPAPAQILRLALGEMAEQLVLASQRVLPKRLLGAGFVFQHATLKEALDSVLKQR